MERLGQAITLRREYLRYCLEHQEQFKQDVNQGGPDEMQGSNEGDKIGNDINTRAETSASSLVLEQLEQIGMKLELDDSHDDARSQASSYVSSVGIGEEQSDRRLHLPKLDDVNGGMRDFECRYCHIVQEIEEQRAWKYVISIRRYRFYQTDHLLQKTRLQ
jgi:hypothetical protein